MDVREISLAHVRALQRESAAGRRIIVSAGPYKFQDWGKSVQVVFVCIYITILAVSIAHSINGKLPVGNTSFDPANPGYKYRYDASLATEILGMDYRSKDQTTRDVLEQLQDFIA